MFICMGAHKNKKNSIINTRKQQIDNKKYMQQYYNRIIMQRQGAPKNSNVIKSDAP